MRKLFYIAVALAMLMPLGSCGDKKAKPIISPKDSVAVENVVDSTLYGVCGEGTSMHVLQLLTDAGDSVNIFISDEEPGIVQGGLLAGDRLAVVATKGIDGEIQAQHVINLTSLIGKWTSLDKNFEIIEGGVVKNNVKAETNPWTSWKILNGKLLLNTDTFSINNLGPDSLYLENSVGIFTFKRQE